MTNPTIRSPVQSENPNPDFRIFLCAVAVGSDPAGVALDSTSTNAEVRAAYDDNASYDDDQSVAKARAFRTACRMLIRRLTEQSSDGDQSLSRRENLRQLREELSRVEQWLGQHDTDRSPPRVVNGDFRNFR